MVDFPARQKTPRWFRPFRSQWSPATGETSNPRAKLRTTEGYHDLYHLGFMKYHGIPWLSNLGLRKSEKSENELTVSGWPFLDPWLSIETNGNPGDPQFWEPAIWVCVCVCLIWKEGNIVEHCGNEFGIMGFEWNIHGAVFKTAGDRWLYGVTLSNIWGIVTNPV